MPAAKTAEIRERALALLGEGASIRQVAKTLGVGKSTVAEWKLQMGDVPGHEFHGNQYVSGSGLSADEQDMVRRYGGMDYTAINAVLRGDKAGFTPGQIDFIHKQVGLIDSAMAKSTLTKDITVYRALPREVAIKEAGTTVTSPAYVSTTYDRESAIQHRDDNSKLNPARGYEVLQATLPAGTHAIDMQAQAGSTDEFAQSRQSTERELLVARDTSIHWELFSPAQMGEGAGHPFHGNQWTDGEGGGEAANVNPGDWQQAVEDMASGWSQMTDRQDADNVYQAQFEVKALDKNAGKRFPTEVAAKTYAERVLAQYAPDAKVEFRVLDMGNRTIGGTRPEAKPDTFQVVIGKDWTSQSNILHELAHVVAMERSAVMSHGAFFREAYLEMLKGEMPDLAASLGAELAKTPSLHAREPQIEVSGHVVAPDGQAVICLALTPKAKMAEADEPAGSLTADDSLIASGLVVKAEDSGRVLMLQRAFNADDPASGLWEFPGGHLEDETPLHGALREWQEELGVALPSGQVVGGWIAPNGVYQAFVYLIPSEAAVDLSARDQTLDPDGDYFEAAAWWDPVDVPGMAALRPECSSSDWNQILRAAEKSDPEKPEAVQKEEDPAAKLASAIKEVVGKKDEPDSQALPPPAPPPPADAFVGQHLVLNRLYIEAMNRYVNLVHNGVARHHALDAAQKIDPDFFVPEAQHAWIVSVLQKADDKPGSPVLLKMGEPFHDGLRLGMAAFEAAGARHPQLLLMGWSPPQPTPPPHVASVYDQYEWLGEDSEALAAYLRGLYRESYLETLNEHLTRSGAPLVSSITDAEILAELDARAAEVAAGVGESFNRELANQTYLTWIDQRSELGRQSSRTTLADEIDDWAAERANWKSDDIVINESGWADHAAADDFIQNNPEAALTGRVEPQDAQCRECQDLVARGTMDAAELAGLDLPAHPNCQHYPAYDIEPDWGIQGGVWAAQAPDLSDEFAASELRFGDVPGHSFHGNQWVSGEGGTQVDAQTGEERQPVQGAAPVWPASPEAFRDMVQDPRQPSQTMSGKPITAATQLLVFHATTPDDAKGLLRYGLDPAAKPMTRARLDYESGQQATFAPGQGVSSGLYVGGHPVSVSGYGRAMVAVNVRAGDLSLPPEVGSGDTLHSLSHGESGVVITSTLPPSAFRAYGQDPKHIPGLDIGELKAGEGPGHPFRGNQYVAGTGGDDEKSTATVDAQSDHAAALFTKAKAEADQRHWAAQNARDFLNRDFKTTGEIQEHIRQAHKLDPRYHDPDLQLTHARLHAPGYRLIQPLTHDHGVAAAELAVFGDVPGHPFHGNQYITGEGGANTETAVRLGAAAVFMRARLQAFRQAGGHIQALDIRQHPERIAALRTESRRMLDAYKANPVQNPQTRQGLVSMVAALHGDVGTGNDVLVAYDHQGHLAAAMSFHAGEAAFHIGNLGSARSTPGAASAIQAFLLDTAAASGHWVASSFTPDSRTYHQAIGRNFRGGSGGSEWSKSDVRQLAAALAPLSVAAAEQARVTASAAGAELDDSAEAAFWAAFWAQPQTFGDVPGHEFHGNQYVSGQAGDGPAVSAGLPGNQRTALARYQLGGYAAINAPLRGVPVEGIGDPQTDEDIKNAAEYTAAIDQAMTPLSATTLYRGADPSCVGALLGMPATGTEGGSTYNAVEAMSEDQLRVALGGLVGHTFTDKGFLSTTKDENFAAIRATFGRVVVALHVPGGVKGVDMNAKLGGDSFKKEQEVLLQRGLTLKITDVTQGTYREIGGDDPANRYVGQSFTAQILHVDVVPK